MNISQLIQAIRAIIGDAFKDRNNPKKWGGWIDVHGADDTPSKIVLDGKFTSAKVELSGIKFTMDIDGASTTLELKPNIHNLHSLDVFIDGALDPEARPVVAPKGTPAHPIRVALDVRPVTFNGHECRFNLRFTE